MRIKAINTIMRIRFETGTKWFVNDVITAKYGINHNIAVQKIITLFCLLNEDQIPLKKVFLNQFCLLI